MPPAPPAFEVLLGSSAAMWAALRWGVIEALLERPMSAEELARALECDARAMSRLLGVLDALGVTVPHEGSAHALHPDALASAAASPGGAAAQLALFRSLPDFVRTGETFLPPDDPAARDAVYEHVVEALGRRFASRAERLATLLGRPVGEVLDVGAGSGVWSLAMGAPVTAVDLPRTLEVFRRHAEGRGVGDRVATIAGDYHTVALPSRRFGRVVLANVLHLESPADAAALVGRAAASVAPGGELVVVDAGDAGSKEEELGLAVYALHLAMRVPRSVVHARRDVEAWASGAGLTTQCWYPLGGGLEALVARAG